MIDTQKRIQMSQALNLSHQDFSENISNAIRLGHMKDRAIEYYKLLDELYATLEPQMPKIQLKQFKPVQEPKITYEDIEDDCLYDNNEDGDDE